MTIQLPLCVNANGVNAVLESSAPNATVRANPTLQCVRNIIDLHPDTREGTALRLDRAAKVEGGSSD
jgi:hypothetical protein